MGRLNYFSECLLPLNSEYCAFIPLLQKLTYLLTYLLIYVLTYSTVQDIIWKADCHSASQKISCFLYEARSFINVFTKTRHRTLSWGSRIQFAPLITISLRSSLILSCHLHVGLPSSLFLSDLPTKTSKHLSLPPCEPHVPPTSTFLL
jgi:hypothetical protein